MTLTVILILVVIHSTGQPLRSPLTQAQETTYEFITSCCRKIGSLDRRPYAAHRGFPHRRQCVCFACRAIFSPDRRLHWRIPGSYQRYLSYVERRGYRTMAKE